MYGQRSVVIIIHKSAAENSLLNVHLPLERSASAFNFFETVQSFVNLETEKLHEDKERTYSKNVHKIWNLLSWNLETVRRPKIQSINIIPVTSS